MDDDAIETRQATESVTSTRRNVLTKAAGGAGLAAAAWAAPAISGLGIAPADAAACTTPPAAPTWSCTSDMTPLCTANTPAIGTATASNIQTTQSGNSTVSSQVASAQVSELQNGVTLDYLAQSCRPTSLCPGESGNYTVTYTIDFCTFYNEALAAAKAGVASGGGNLRGFSISVSNIVMSWAGQTATFPNFSSNSLTPIAACPTTRTFTIPVTVDPYPAIVLDPVTCTYTCPTAPGAPALPAAFSTPPTFTATQSVYTQVSITVIIQLVGAATTTADLTGVGELPPNPGLVTVPATCA